jgi:hypothetical protein
MPPIITTEQRELLRSLLNETPAPLLRSEFDRLTAQQKSDFLKAGGKLGDDPKPPRRLVPPQAAYQMTRADYLQAEAADKLRSTRD